LDAKKKVFGNDHPSDAKHDAFLGEGKPSLDKGAKLGDDDDDVAKEDNEAGN